MNTKNVFDKYRAKLAREGWFTSIVCALAFGFLATFVSAFVFWMVEIPLLWLCVVIGVVVTAAIAPIFYFKKFRPNEQEIARRLDRLGFDERMITMNEFEKDESYIAQIQREDAAQTLLKGEKEGKKIKFQLAGGKRSARKIAFATGASGFVGIAMSVVLGLTIMGTLPGGKTLVYGEELPVQYMVSYMEGDGYVIVGVADQVVEAGESTSEVTVVCEDGWAFVQWVNASDQDANDTEADKTLLNPVRHEENVQKDMVFYALCVEAGEGDGDGQNSDSEDDDAPPPEEQPPSGGSSSPSESEPGTPGTGAGMGNYKQDNTVINGDYESVDYSEIYDEYYNSIMEKLANSDLSPEERAFLENYFNSMK